jgi:hypothetical protein
MIDEEHNQKEKNVYFSNMKKIIKHYPMTDRLIVRRGYMNLALFGLYCMSSVCLAEKYQIPIL